MNVERLVRKAERLCRIFEKASDSLKNQQTDADSPKNVALRKAEIYLEGSLLGLREEVAKYYAEQREAVTA